MFLDEIGELPVDLQAKLLRAIQEKEIRPVGGTKRMPINVRILAATNRDLEAAVAEGKFRRDLYFRLNVLTLRIPPLRERKQDIPLLVEHFLERLARSTGYQRTLSDEAMKLMLAYDWPGNVRELENCLERACAMSSGTAAACGRSAHRHAELRKLHSAVPASMPSGPASCRWPKWKSRRSWAPSTSCSGDKLMAARAAGHRQDHPVSQAEGVLLPGLNWVPPAGFVTGNGQTADRLSS